MNQSSFTSVISPRSSFGPQKRFEFETQDAQDYIDTLEENLLHHTRLLKNILPKPTELPTEDTDPELKSPHSLEKLLTEVQELYQNLKTVESERKTFKSKSLINELLIHEHKEKINEITTEYEEKLTEMRFHIDRRDKLIYDLQKTYTELEMQSSFKQANDNLLILPLHSDILSYHSGIEEIREMIATTGEDVNFTFNLKLFLVEFYKKVWRKAQIVQALLRNPVNTKEKGGKSVRLNIENEEPDETLEFEGSDIEENGHFRAYTMSNESFESPAHKRHTLSSGKDLISAVRSKLVGKIEKSEKKLTMLTNDFQKFSGELCKIGQENFQLTRENAELVSALQRQEITASKI